MIASDKDPIVAIATAPGRGGIGVVRVSGADLGALIARWFGRPLIPRHASFLPFPDRTGIAIDEGIALYFSAPNSYTGEDVLELQAHGGPAVLALLVARVLELGREEAMRLAEPGEFTRRAFLNDKIDLAQAEAVADLIDANSAAAARSARSSLSGTFSQAIDALVGRLIKLRTLVEATLDFPEEEIDFLKKADASGQLREILASLDDSLERSSQGAILRNGLKVVLAGRPNVGKSSLLNALADAEVAIVTALAGTTRDRVSQTIAIDGIELHIIDTAGLRETTDEIERIGIARSWDAIRDADVILNMQDANDPETDEDRAIVARLPIGIPLRTVFNKIDRGDRAAENSDHRIYLSAKTGEGVELLRAELLAIAGWHSSAESVFLARERHLIALRSARLRLARAVELSEEGSMALDLYAEELRLAQHDLSSITGEFTADDLLGEIFGRFCIGK